MLVFQQVHPIPLGLLNSFLASMVAGIVVTGVMNPLDTISTRLYNQGNPLLISNYGAERTAVPHYLAFLLET